MCIQARIPLACLVCLALLAVVGGCSPRAEPTPLEGSGGTAWFEEVSAKVGLDFVNDPGPEGSYFMPQSMGNGAALLDYDQDGRLDIYLLNGAGPGSSSANALYHQEPDGHFRDVSAGSGLDVVGFGSGVAIGDVNNDGWPDVFVSEYGGLRLFTNDGQGHFRDATATSGIASLRWGTSASFLDFDRDGWLDLVVVNYVAYDPAKLCYGPDGSRDFCSPSQFDGSPALLFRNVTASAGEMPRFSDITASSGIGELPGPGLGVLCADFDGDNWDDIFVANDQAANRLWINQHDRTFRDEAPLRGLAVNSQGKVEANMGVAWGDVDDDGLSDLFVTHLDSESHTLWKQGPRGLFADRTAAAGLIRVPRSTGFGVVMGDFDLDSDLDLAYVSGGVLKKTPAAPLSRRRHEGSPDSGFWDRYAQPNFLLDNHGPGQFTSIAASNPALCGQPDVTRALCCGDLDNDGDLDLLAATTAGRALLLHNIVDRKGHWLIVRALDPDLKRDAFGAIVTVRAQGRLQQRLVNPGSSYLSSHDPRVHFGLAGAEEYSAIHVRWPDGTHESFPGGATDRVVVIRRGEGKAR